MWCMCMLNVCTVHTCTCWMYEHMYMLNVCTHGDMVHAYVQCVLMWCMYMLNGMNACTQGACICWVHTHNGVCTICACWMHAHMFINMFEGGCKVISYKMSVFQVFSMIFFGTSILDPALTLGLDRVSQIGFTRLPRCARAVCWHRPCSAPDWLDSG